MQKYQLYVGANNTTKEVEKKKLVEVLSPVFTGFTWQEVQGFWAGEPENSVIVTLYSDESSDKVRELARNICRELDQQAVLVEINGVGEMITA